MVVLLFGICPVCFSLPFVCVIKSFTAALNERIQQPCHDLSGFVAQSALEIGGLFSLGCICIDADAQQSAEALGFKPIYMG